MNTHEEMGQHPSNEPCPNRGAFKLKEGTDDMCQTSFLVSEKVETGKSQGEHNPMCKEAMQTLKMNTGRLEGGTSTGSHPMQRRIYRKVVESCLVWRRLMDQSLAYSGRSVQVLRSSLSRVASFFV